MDVSGPVLPPVREAIADILEPRSKPASLVLDSLIGPVLASLSSGPLMARLAESVPPLSEAPEGSVTPRAGSMACNSSTGMLCPTSFMSNRVESPWVR